MQSINGPYFDSNPNHLYQNLNIISNQVTDPTGPNPEVKFEETRASPLINDASQYYLSIIRFSMEGPPLSIPIILPQIKINQPDINETVQSVTLYLTIRDSALSPALDQTFIAQNFVQFSPDNKDETAPRAPVQKQDLYNKYYWIQSINSFVTMINQSAAWCINDSTDPRNATPGTPSLNSLQGQFNAFQTATYGGTAPAIKTLPPILVWNPTTELFTWLLDTYSFGGPSRTSASSAQNEEAYLQENSNMWGLLPNFEANFFANNNALGQVYEIVCKPIGANQNVIQTVDPTTASLSTPTQWQVTQDSPGASNLWSPVQSIVFCTTLIPSVAEQISAPVVLQNDGNNFSRTVGSAFLNQVTDIEVPISNPMQLRDATQYSPSAEYRLVDLGSSKTAIQNVDMRVFWKSKLNQELQPLEMFNLSTVSMKLLFRRKTA